MKLIHIKAPSVPTLLGKTRQEINELVYDKEFMNGNLQSFVSGLTKYEYDGIILSNNIDDQNIDLEICIRIRLSLGALKEKAYKSIFIYSEKSASDILKKQIQQCENTTASVLMTSGLFTFDSLESLVILINNSQNFNLLSDSNYKSAFLDLLILKKPKEIGNHGLANIWGAYRLAEVSGNLDSIYGNPKQQHFQQDLYMMSLIAIRPINSEPSTQEKKVIASEGKNILLIDDEADKGWGDVLKAIFKDSKFKLIENDAMDDKSAFYNNSLKLASETEDGLPIWDLILLDLRLDENEDLGENSYKRAKDYSGAKLLNKIKKLNEGIQVLMFTASNKAWNMRELLELGANGFFIKESPIYYHDYSISEYNYEKFHTQVEDCFRKQFLKSIYAKLLPLQNICKKELEKKPKNYQLSIPINVTKRLDDQLFIFSKLLQDLPFELRYSFSSLMLFIEEIANIHYYEDGGNQIVNIDFFTKKKCYYSKEGCTYLALTPLDDGKAYEKSEYKLVLDDEYLRYGGRKTPFNYKLTCILHFKFGLPLDNSIYKYFEIYRLRSDSVMHTGTKVVSEEIICLMIELLYLIIR